MGYFTVIFLSSFQ